MHLESNSGYIKKKVTSLYFTLLHWLLHGYFSGVTTATPLVTPVRLHWWPTASPLITMQLFH